MDFPKFYENKSCEKYLLFPTAKKNPREKTFSGNCENTSPRKKLLVFAKLKKTMLIERVDSQTWTL